MKQLLAAMLALTIFPAHSAAFAQMDAKGGVRLAPTDLERVAVGQPAPDFTLEDSDRRPVTLSDYRGKNNVVLVFYRGRW